MGMPAARISDMTVCPMVTTAGPVPVPHVGGPISTPSAVTVLIGKLPAAGIGSVSICVGPPSSIVKGSVTVLAGKIPLARVGDQTAHGGNIVLGCFTVLAGG